MKILKKILISLFIIFFEFVNARLADSYVENIVSQYISRIDPRYLSTIRSVSDEFFIQAPKALQIPNKYIIYLDSTITEEVKNELYSIFEAIKGRIYFKYETTFTGFAVELPFDLPVESLKKIPFIKRIETDFVVEGKGQRQNLPSDGRFWSLDRLDGADDDHYSFSFSGKGVNVYILDSGIDENHSEFTGRARSVYVSPILRQSGGFDCTGHGTHVAGIIGGNIVGIAKETNLFSLRIIDCDNRSSNSQLLDALQWINNNLQLPAVLNLSLGPNKGDNDVYPKSPAVEAALTQLVSKGVVIVAAAGNDNLNPCDGTPAGTPGVITVGVVDKSNKRTFYSNYGSCIDIFASGVQILSAAPNGQYETKQGTSQAAPHVTGVVALILQSNPRANSETVLETLRNIAKRDVVIDANGSPNFFLQSLLVDGVAPNVPLGDANKINPPPNENLFQILIYVGIALGGVLLLFLAAIFIRKRTRVRSKKSDLENQWMPKPIGTRKKTKANGIRSNRPQQKKELLGYVNGRRPSQKQQLRMAKRSHSNPRMRTMPNVASVSMKSRSEDTRLLQITARSKGQTFNSKVQIPEKAQPKIPASRPPGAPLPLHVIRRSRSANLPRVPPAIPIRDKRKSSYPVINRPTMY